MKIIVIVILPEDLSQICLDKISTKYFKTCRQNCNKGWVVWSLFIKSFHVIPQKSVKSGHWPSECSLTCLLCYCIISHQKLFFEERTNDEPSQDHIIPPLESFEEERDQIRSSFLPSVTSQHQPSKMFSVAAHDGDEMKLMRLNFLTRDHFKIDTPLYS